MLLTILVYMAERQKVPRKEYGMHNVDIMTVLAAQIEVLVKKLNNPTQSINMVHELASV